MKEVKHLVHHIDEEVKDDLYYAEKYVEKTAWIRKMLAM